MPSRNFETSSKIKKRAGGIILSVKRGSSLNNRR
jgi:hypothetical protein